MRRESVEPCRVAKQARSGGLGMAVASVTSRVFTYKADTAKDSDGHSHPAPERDARMALLTVADVDRNEGHMIAAPHLVREDLLADLIRPVLVGADPLRMERNWRALYKWQRGSGG